MKKTKYFHLFKKGLSKFDFTLKAGMGDGVSFRGLFVAAGSLPLFFTTVLESRISDIFCCKRKKEKKRVNRKISIPTYSPTNTLFYISVFLMHKYTIIQSFER